MISIIIILLCVLFQVRLLSVFDLVLSCPTSGFADVSLSPLGLLLGLPGLLGLIIIIINIFIFIIIIGIAKTCYRSNNG